MSLLTKASQLQRYGGTWTQNNVLEADETATIIKAGERYWPILSLA